jgi:hypothetical protein
MEAIRSAGAELDRAHDTADIPFALVASRAIADTPGPTARFPNVFYGYDEIPRLDLGPVVARYRPVTIRRAKYDRTVVFEADGEDGIWCTVECRGSADAAAGLLHAVRQQAASALTV